MSYREPDRDAALRDLRAELIDLRARVERIDHDTKPARRANWMIKVGDVCAFVAVVLGVMAAAAGLFGMAWGVWDSASSEVRETERRCRRVCQVHDMRFEWVASGCVCSSEGEMRSFYTNGSAQ